MNKASAPMAEQQLKFSGYRKRDVPAPDTELSSTMPNTPMGEYMRQYWQPVCLSEELNNLPKAIRIMGEDLVAFRDKRGKVGVLHRHCAHRGASLEYGVIRDVGISCCYHGWHFDVDGTLLEAPCETDDTRLKQTVSQGAYPAFERDGLVFAYMGPPEKCPPFPEYDSYTLPEGTKLAAFSNVYPCNWLQVHENIMDHMHTAVLHNSMVADGVDAKAEGTSIEGMEALPIMQWQATREGNGIAFIAGRRLENDKVWVRMTEMNFPNYLQIGTLVPSGLYVRHSTSSCTRWHVPVDDTNMIIFGWRHYNSEVDPEGVGTIEDCGVDKIDFIVGQTGNRTYEEGQRAPGDWEALTSQRPIAVHALENPGSSDVGVYMFRKLLRDAVQGKTAPDARQQQWLAAGESLSLYTQDSVLHAPTKETPAEDRKLVLELGKTVMDIMRAADALPKQERDAFVRTKLDEIDGGRGKEAEQNAARAAVEV